MIKHLQGQCLCGDVTYQVEDDFQYALICHCSQCRRATGAANKAFAGIERTKLTLHAAPEQVMRFGDGDNHDIRCARCGSLLYSVVNEGQSVHVTLGTLTDEPTTRPSAHIFVTSKASWDPILDDLPQFDGLPD